MQFFKPYPSPFALILSWWFILLVIPSTAQDTISLNRPLREGQALVSAHGNFKLGFFSPGNGGKYVGIWFNNIPGQTFVWVGNREKPLLDSSGVLQITNNSVLELINGTGGIVWSTNASRSVRNPIVQLLDSGNLVIRDQNDATAGNYLWQSFDHPCDALLPQMKLGRDPITGSDLFLTSWNSSNDPSPGIFTYRINPHGYPQPILYKNSVEVSRNGPWNGFWFSGNSILDPDPTFNYEFVFNNTDMYYTYDVINSSVISVNRLLSVGIMQRVLWDNRTQGWAQFLSMPIDSCDLYEVCGAFGICNLVNSPHCQCMKGYVPKSPQNWEQGNWSDGCVPIAPLNCSTDKGFIKYSNVKLPDTRNSTYSTTMTLDECQKQCVQNCSCVAYANLYASLETDGGSGCLLWFDTLIDVRVFSGRGQDLYVRVASSGSGEKRIWISLCSSLLGLLLFSGIILLVLRRRKAAKRKAKVRGGAGESSINNCKNQDSELPIFAFNVVAHATNLFSNANKLGEGGFGPVYKGVLDDGQEIAVKRLSKDSKQGLEEFKNEALFIAKLQHRNLVKLIGCCIEAEEQMLIYEYMPNKSLDYFIFDERSRGLLDWPQRFEIIKGIARGLLYLHQDSRLRIVHRDLKASNVLLDSEMNAKISDFGMARSFDGCEDEVKTKRVVGTYGYMPPEYTVDGLFSVKSDVFSFGVLILEIVSGKRNRGFNHPNHHHNLLGHAWMLFKEGATLDIVDPLIRSSSYEVELQRVIHIALLCVQLHPEDRPSMPLVTVMFSSSCELTDPKQPGFYTERYVQQGAVSGKTESSSNDEMTITLLSGR